MFDIWFDAMQRLAGDRRLRQDQSGTGMLSSERFVGGERLGPSHCVVMRGSAVVVFGGLIRFGPCSACLRLPLASQTVGLRYPLAGMKTVWWTRLPRFGTWSAFMQMIDVGMSGQGCPRRVGRAGEGDLRKLCDLALAPSQQHPHGFLRKLPRGVIIS